MQGPYRTQKWTQGPARRTYSNATTRKSPSKMRNSGRCFTTTSDSGGPGSPIFVWSTAPSCLIYVARHSLPHSTTKRAAGVSGGLTHLRAGVKEKEIRPHSSLDGIINAISFAVFRPRRVCTLGSNKLSENRGAECLST